MSLLRHIVFALAYVAMAVTVALALPTGGDGAPRGMGLLLGLAILVAGGLIQEVLARREEAEQQNARLDALEGALEELTGQLQRAAYDQAAGRPAPARQVASETHEIVETQPSGGEIARRVTVLAFGIIQVLLLVRIVLMLLNANEAQPLVSGLLMLSQPFVAPFEGIFGGTAANGSGSILDVAAIVALVGWSLLEVVILWLVNVFKREAV